MKILTKYGQEQVIKLINEEKKLRRKAWLSFSPNKIINYYKELSHRKQCEECRKFHTKQLAKLAGVKL